MENKPNTWLIIKYKENSFDVKLSDKGNVIREIRPIDSEINIVAILDKKVIYAILAFLFLGLHLSFTRLTNTKKLLIRTHNFPSTETHFFQIFFCLPVQ
jgi:hypothetical protein